MGKFATNKNGNIDSGTEVLANNMVFLQETKEDAISNLYGDLFNEGIININMGTDANPIEPFQLKEGTVVGKFSVGIGIGYKQNANTGLYNRIAILEETDYHNEIFGDSTYPDGRGINQKTYTGIESEYVDTPKSTGCINIDIPTTALYYVDLRYLSVCDNGNNGDGLNLINYSIAKNIVPTSTEERKRFYKWIDGYEIKLVQSTAEIQGICLGTVQKDISNNITFTDEKRANGVLIKSTAFMEYFASGSGMTIIEEDGEKKLSINVDNVTTEIEDNKVRVTKDGLYPYTKFIVNSGNINNDGTANVLLTDNVGINVNFGVGTETPLTVSPAYNDRYTVSSSDEVTRITEARAAILTEYSEVANGTYTICINNTDKDNNNEPLEKAKLEIMKKVVISREQPTIQKGVIWFDTSKEPYHAKWCNGVSWLEYHGVPIGEATIDTISMSVSSIRFGNEINDQVKMNSCILYNANADEGLVRLFMTDTGRLQVTHSKGIIFMGDVGFYLTGDSASNAVINIKAAEIQINGQPAPRLPDYGSKVANFVTSSSANNTDDSATTTADGWLLLKRVVGSSGGDDAWFTINGKTIHSFASNYTGEVAGGLYFVKKGWTIKVRRGFSADFYACL